MSQPPSNITVEHLDKLLATPELMSSNTWVIDRIEFDLPVNKDNSKRERTWKRRVIKDLVPDYPLADAPEKSLYRILRTLTDPEETKHDLSSALDNDLNPLLALYQIRLGTKNLPVAFHALAAKSLRGKMRCRVFKENTFLLLCRKEDGVLDEPLIREFIERFRSNPEQLELSQSVVLNCLEPAWDPEKSFRFNLDGYREKVKPFLPRAAKHFRRDLRTLLAINAPQSEFFRLSNYLLALHFGLYQTRLATVLNPGIKTILDAMTNPDSVNVEELERIENGRCQNHLFQGSIWLRSPDIGYKRSLRLNAPSRESYLVQRRELAELHFSLLMLNRLRELAKSYLLATRDLDPNDTVDEWVQYPSQIVNRLKTERRFHTFIRQAFTDLCAKFINDQLEESRHDDAKKLVESQPTSVHGLKALFEYEARTGLSSPSKNKAVQTGIEILESLLKKGDVGIINTRAGVGKYMELGVGLLPLLLLLIIGPEREKVQLEQLWKGLADYGLRMAPEDRELLLMRLKSMGLYERFSDAGEANYVRSLLGAAQTSECL